MNQALAEQKALMNLYVKAIMKRIFAVCACSMVTSRYLVRLNSNAILAPEFIHEYDEAAGLHLDFKTTELLR